MPEVVNCPQCDRKLRVPEELLGKKVKCPTCGNTFTATAAAAAGAEAAPAPPPPPPPQEAPRSAGPKGDFDFQEEERPSRRPQARREREDEDYDRPRRRGGDYAPHRGTMILVFGILAIVGVCSIVFGPMAWIMGNNDLKEIRAGRMDPEGEGNTNVGRILGMIATCLQAVGLVCGCIWVIFSVAMGAAGAHR